LSTKIWQIKARKIVADKFNTRISEIQRTEKVRKNSQVKVKSMDLKELRNKAADSVCLMVQPSPSALPIFFPKHKAQSNKLEAAKKSCPYSKEYLSDLYVNKKMSRSKLAEFLGVKMGRINRWLTALDIRLDADQYGAGMREGRKFRLSDPISIRRRLQAIGRKGPVDMYGYNLIFNSMHPKARVDGYVSEHRVVIEQQIKRFMEKHEDVHHLNYKRDDNRLSNLMLLTDSDHCKIHVFMEKIGAYVLGLSDSPEPLELSSPAFWNGNWYQRISMEDLATGAN